MTVVVQKEVTLDQAVLNGTKPFPNGCAYRVLFDERGHPWLDYGCYRGPWADSGDHQLLADWFHKIMDEPIIKFKVITKMIEPRLPLDISPETILELKRREPCKQCGAPWFKPLYDIVGIS